MAPISVANYFQVLASLPPSGEFPPAPRKPSPTTTGQSCVGPALFPRVEMKFGTPLTTFKLLPPPSSLFLKHTAAPSLVRKLARGRISLKKLPKGYCYLSLFYRFDRAGAAYELGAYPTGPELVDYFSSIQRRHPCPVQISPTGSSNVYHVSTKTGPKRNALPTSPFARVGATNAIGKLESQITNPEHLYNLQTDYLVKLRYLTEHVDKYSHYQLGPEQARFLNSIGIGYNPYASGNHPHPLSKTIELFVLRCVIPPLLARQDFTALSMKEKKYNTLLSDLEVNPDRETYLHNYALETKDLTRYGFGARAGDFQPIDTGVAFFHDMAHYLTPDDFCAIFASSPNLHTIYATVIIPPETLFGVTSGCGSSYSFRCRGDTLDYAPDGFAGESYSQPIGAQWILKTKHIIDRGNSYSLTTLQQIDSTFVVAITRGMLLVDRTCFATVPGKTRVQMASSSPTDASPFVCSETLSFMENFTTTSVNPTPRTIRARLAMRCSDNKHLNISQANRDLIVARCCTLIGTDNPASSLVANNMSLLSAIRHSGIMTPFTYLTNFLSGYLYTKRRNSEDRTWSATYQIHTERLDIAGEAVHTALISGSRPPPTLAEARMAMYACLNPRQIRSHHLQLPDLLGEGQLHVVSPFLAACAEAYLISHLVDRFPRARFIKEAVKLARKGASFFLRSCRPNQLLYMAVIPPLMLVAATTTAALSRRANSAVINGIAKLLQNVWLASASRFPFLVQVDFAVHKLFSPPNGSLLYTPRGELEAPAPDTECETSTTATPTPPSSPKLTPEDLEAPKAPEFDSLDINNLPDPDQILMQALMIYPDQVAVRGEGTPPDILHHSWVKRGEYHFLMLSSEFFKTSHMNPDSTTVPHDALTIPCDDELDIPIALLRGATQLGFAVAHHQGENGEDQPAIPLNEEFDLAVIGHLGLSFVIWFRRPELLGSGKLTTQVPPPADLSRTCMLNAIAIELGVTFGDLWELIVAHPTLDWHSYSQRPFPLGLQHLRPLCEQHDWTAEVLYEGSSRLTTNPGSKGKKLRLTHSDFHWEPTVNRAPNPLRAPKRGKVSCLNSHLDMLTGEFSLPYRFQKKRAKHALLGIEKGVYGVLLPKEKAYLAKLRSLLDAPPTYTRAGINISGVLGEPGTGKTHPMTQLIKLHHQRTGRYQDVTIIVPTDNLRNQLITDLNLPPGKGFVVRTWELAFLQPLAPTVILDDAGLIPPVLDLMILANAHTRRMYFTGDSAQNVYQPSTEVPYHSYASDNLSVLGKSACTYLRHGHRLAKGVANSLNAATSSDIDCELRRGESIHSPSIVSTRGMVATFTELGRIAHTSNTSQGTTINSSYNLILDQYSALASDRSLYTALTRGRYHVYISVINNKPDRLLRSNSTIAPALADFLLSGSSTNLSAAIRNHKIAHTPTHLLDPLNRPGKKIPSLNNVLQSYSNSQSLLGCGNLNEFGTYLQEQICGILTKPSIIALAATSAVTWELGRRSYNPEHFQHLLETVTDLSLHYLPFQQPDVPGWSPLEAPTSLRSDGFEFALPAPLPFNTHELCTTPGLIKDAISMITPLSKVENRERQVGEAMTQQVNGEDEATALFLKHKRTDHATQTWTYKERIVRPSRPGNTYIGGGYALFQAFNTVYKPQYPAFNQQVYDAMQAEDAYRLAEKGPAALEKISYRNGAMLDQQMAEVFLKGQDITKLGTEYRDAKKGQMITSFGSHVNAQFGPLSRYVYSAIRTALPPEILLLNGVTLQDQEDWFQQHWDFKAPCYEDDYTGFDGTQNEEFLTFQVLVYQACGIPDSIIEDYVKWDTHITTAMGDLGVVIPSGLKQTWLNNTLDNMAFQALKHNLTPHTELKRVARAFSGDDSAHNELITIRHEFARLPHCFKLISTGSHTEIPHFCGTINLPCGTFADPRLLALRCLYRMRRGSLPTAALSYAESCSRLQRVLSSSLPYLTSQEVLAHSISFRLLRWQLLKNGLSLAASFFTGNLFHTFDLSGGTDPIMMAELPKSWTTHFRSQ